MTTAQVVRPAGAGHETLWVLLASACVLAVAAVLIGVRSQPEAGVALQSHQLDARTQLNAAEQGVHADLLVAAEEIEALAESAGVPPRVEQLREMGLPPFSAGVDASARGGHEWRLGTHGRELAYVGRSAQPEVAGSFLLRLPPDHAGHAGHSDHAAPGQAPAAQVWLHRQGSPAWPESLDDAALVRQGWRQVVVRYDGGVTRQELAR